MAAPVIYLARVLGAGANVEGPNAVLNVVTIPPGATPTQARLVLDGVRGAIFVYGTGGTLIGSWASAAGTDPYGKAYPQGFSVSLGIIIGPQIVVDGTNDGLFVYASGTTPGLGNPPIIALSNGTADPYGNSVRPGDASVNASLIALGTHFGTNAFVQLIASLSPSVNLGTGDASENSPGSIGSIITGSGPSRTVSTLIESPDFTGGAFAQLLLTSPSLDGTTSGTIAQIGSAGPLQSLLTVGASSNRAIFSYLDPATVTWGIERNQTDTTKLTNANGTGAFRISAIYNIADHDSQIGTIYEIEVPFSATMQGNTLELGLSIDGAVGFTVNNTISGAIVGAGIGINGNIRVKIQVTAIGSGGFINAFTGGDVNQASQPTTFANSGGLAGNIAGAVAWDATVAHTIRVNSLWGAANAGQTVSGWGSKFTRSGP